MRANVTALTLTDGKVPQLTREPRASPAPAQEVEARKVPREALRRALELAQGDPSRLTFDADGTVTVNNRPRPARRTQEHSR